MEKSFGCVRYVYNWALERRITTYKANKTKVDWMDLCRELTLLKRNPDTIWLRNASVQSLQMSIRNMDSAYNFFFAKKNSFPKFKSKHGKKQSFQYTSQVRIDFAQNKIHLPKLGWVKFFKNREFYGDIRTTTVSKTLTGKYFVSVLTDDHREEPIKVPINNETAIGIDVGLKSFAVLSNGEVIKNPRYLERVESRIAVLQRRFAKKQKDSKRREKARVALAKQYEKVTNKRVDFLHKLTSRLVRENQTIIIEDLDIEGMLKDHNLTAHIISASWAEFFRQLQYKCNWRGKNLIKIGRFEPSSKMCECGYINKDLKLSDRKWICPSCGRHNDRDLLAAQNIKRFGLAKITPGGAGEERVEGRGYEPVEARISNKKGR